MLRVPDTLTILVDKQEKDFATFPKLLDWQDSRGHRQTFTITTERVILETGDYALKGYTDICLIERKGSLEELHKNLISADRHRFRRCVFRLVSQCKFPYVFLDMDMARTSGYVPNEGQVLDRLFQLSHLAVMVLKRNLTVWWVDGCKSVTARQTLGERMLRLLWNHAWESQFDNVWPNIDKEKT